MGEQKIFASVDKLYCSPWSFSKKRESFLVTKRSLLIAKQQLRVGRGCAIFFSKLNRFRVELNSLALKSRLVLSHALVSARMISNSHTLTLGGSSVAVTNQEGAFLKRLSSYFRGAGVNFLAPRNLRGNLTLVSAMNFINFELLRAFCSGRVHMRAMHIDFFR